MSKRLCFLVTDAISFNVLTRGQLEYIRDYSDFDITLICGGSREQLDILRARNVGKVVNARFQRNPSVLKDAKSLTYLTYYLLFNRFDVIVYSTPKALLLGSLASFITLHRNSIALVRGRAYENFSGKKRKVYEILDRTSLLVSNEVIFISRSLEEAYLKDKLVSNNKTILLGAGSSNGVDTSKYIPKCSLENVDKQFQCDYEPSVFTVVVVGRICSDKGLQDLSEVIKKIEQSSVRFLLVGQIEDEASESFLSSLMSNYSCIQHIPYTPDIVKYFQQADLHLLLSHREGFGNVAIEAASCGVPTFAYDVVGVRDSVNNGISGQRFKFRDTSAIAKAIDKAAIDSKFHQRYAGARDWVIENFEQKAVWQNYLNFYLQNS